MASSNCILCLCRLCIRPRLMRPRHLCLCKWLLCGRILKKHGYAYSIHGKNNTVSQILGNFAHVQMVESRRSFRPSVNARYEAISGFMYLYGDHVTPHTVQYMVMWLHVQYAVHILLLGTLPQMLLSIYSKFGTCTSFSYFLICLTAAAFV